MGLPFHPQPKAEPLVLQKRTKRLTLAQLERECRAAVKQRDHGRCVVPGCKEHGDHLHHIVPRSLSKRLRWLTSNNCLLCAYHHGLRHAGKITITGNADEHLTITGDAALLRFKL